MTSDSLQATHFFVYDNNGRNFRCKLLYIKNGTFDCDENSLSVSFPVNIIKSISVVTNDATYNITNVDEIRSEKFATKINKYSDAEKSYQITNKQKESQSKPIKNSEGTGRYKCVDAQRNHLSFLNNYRQNLHERDIVRREAIQYDIDIIESDEASEVLAQDYDYLGTTHFMSMFAGAQGNVSRFIIDCIKEVIPKHCKKYSFDHCGNSSCMVFCD